MAPKESSSSKLTMKLLVNSKTQRVLYAEAGKEVVDFLFSLLTLPVGTVVKLLSTDTMVGSVGNLYGSVEKLDDTYISREDAKKALLTPVAGCQTKMTTQLVEVVDPDAGAVPSAAAGAGFVQRIVTYTVMDDLKVSPMSSISGITLLNKCGVTDIGSLQEKTVQLGYDEVTTQPLLRTDQLVLMGTKADPARINILAIRCAGTGDMKASLQSKTVLTDVFLPKKQRK
uniref:DUF674 domain-containing protein n=1 Tax=Triticum urartu TaxID=4572 RepID=A0A8R7TRS9_TRIUA